MSEVSAAFVKKGFWINHANGRVFGATITTDITTGTIVVAILAILSSLATGHFWNIMVFLIHQLQADGKPKNGHYIQRQALLRTIPPPTTFLTELARIIWTWRSQINIWSFLGLPLFAAIFGVVTLAVSILSSYVVDSTNLDVLVQSPHCGRVNYSYPDTQSKINTYMSSIQDVAKPYAQDCYTSDQNLPHDCSSIYTNAKIPFTTRLVACPFEDAMCLLGGSTPAIEFDSGLVDLNDGFGMNIPSGERVKFRKKDVCALLPVTSDHYTVIPAANFSSNERPILAGEELVLVSYSNDTTPQFEFNLMYTNFSEDYQMTGMISRSSPTVVSKNFQPLDSMAQDDADIVLLEFFRNGVGYWSPVDDPMFSAHKKWASSEYTMYMADFPIAMLGCTAQYQYCFNRPSKEDYCIPLSPSLLSTDVTHTLFPGASALQLSIISVLQTSSMLMDITRATNINASSYLASGGFANALSNNQWQIELAAWESMAWAGLQVAITDYAIGAKVRDKLADKYIVNATTKAEKKLCGMQKMRKTGGFVNIHVFGLSLIVACALLAAAVDMLLLRFLIYLSRFRRALAPRLDRWVQDGVLQLQRRAYEVQGEGTWTNLNEVVPVTLEKDLLHELSKESLPPWSRIRHKAGYAAYKSCSCETNECGNPVKDDKSSEVQDGDVEKKAHVVVSPPSYAKSE